ncbi:hypothetical protein BS47DRAFT_1341437 [Hydnum rufescens UP504]|uniref:Uncharacterized protein n=1 Tax=Hydnum rufescens UP504 TaxID=1448309 RepID=A0A9P6DYM6_9AGAM|nr:hypothetical protein BS47DRAFT_1341437 [Hydnum rufescens UP504]
MVQMTAQPGLLPLMEYLATRGIRNAICTRNFDRPVQHLLDTFLKDVEISPIVTRAFKPPKPDPAGVQHISRVWGMPTSEMIMVGDSLDDMLAGRRAGTRTVLLLAGSGSNAHVAKDESTDCVIDRWPPLSLYSNL